MPPPSPPTFLELLDPLHILLSSVILILLMVVLWFGLRHRNHPVVSLHCIFLSALLSAALFLNGHLVRDHLESVMWSNILITGRMDAYIHAEHSSTIAATRKLATIQTLFGLALTAALVLTRSRRIDAPPS